MTSLTIRAGRARATLRTLADYAAGEGVALDAGPLAIYAGDRLIGVGDLVAVGDGGMGVRVTALSEAPPGRTAGLRRPSRPTG